MNNRCPPLSAKIAGIILACTTISQRSLVSESAIKEIIQLLSKELNLDQTNLLISDGQGITDISANDDYRFDSNASYATFSDNITSNSHILLVSNKNKVHYLSDAIESEPYLHTHINIISVPLLNDDTPTGALIIQPNDTFLDSLESIIYVLQIIAAIICQILHISRLIAEKTLSLKEENIRLKNIKRLENGSVYGIIGKSKSLTKALKEAHKAATSEATVMLVGESGCGKERFARMIHLASSRRNEPFVCINCAAIPETLLESELFGHEKGAFTGATSSRQGKFELASNGTLFLDEIGDMDLDLQVKLLRVLQEKTIQRLGSNKEININARIITATHQKLENAVKSGKFRLDLFYRLNVIPISLPPLRERKTDIELLTLYFLARYNHKHFRNVALSGNAMHLLTEYEWPGNVRQLENVIERLVIMVDDDFSDTIEIENIMTEESKISLFNIHASPNVNNSNIMDESDFRPYQKVSGTERNNILDILSKTGGNKTLAARKLGLTTRQLRYRLQKLNI